MVGVAQLVEHWVVAPVVAGSSPVTHPIIEFFTRGLRPFFIKPSPPFIKLSINPLSIQKRTLLDGHCL